MVAGVASWRAPDRRGIVTMIAGAGATSPGLLTSYLSWPPAGRSSRQGGTAMRSFHRHLRRTIAAAALGGIAVASAACGSTGGQAVQPVGTATVTTTVSPPGTPAAAVSPTATPTQPGPLPCPTSALQASMGQGNGAAGSTYYPLVFTNTSGADCTLFGYPGVSFVTGIGGSQIGRAASRNPALSSEQVTLAAGGSAHASLQVVNAANYSAASCHQVTVHWLKIYPPNQTAPLYLSFTASACQRQAKPVNILAVEAVRPGSA